MDESMFDIIVENLYRVLMNNLFEEDKKTSDALIQKEDQPKLIVPCKADEKLMKVKVNIMKVLFEMLNFVESKAETSSDWESENPTYTKIIKDSSLYI
jgi:hypothetical protein